MDFTMFCTWWPSLKAPYTHSPLLTGCCLTTVRVYTNWLRVSYVAPNGGVSGYIISVADEVCWSNAVDSFHNWYYTSGISNYLCFSSRSTVCYSIAQPHIQSESEIKYTLMWQPNTIISLNLHSFFSNLRENQSAFWKQAREETAKIKTLYYLSPWIQLDNTSCIWQQAMTGTNCCAYKMYSLLHKPLMF